MLENILYFKVTTEKKTLLGKLGHIKRKHILNYEVTLYLTN